jgi:hypothetical protein
MLRGIVEYKREEVAKRWRKLHHEELHNLYSLLNIIIIGKLRIIRWARHIECIGKEAIPATCHGGPSGCETLRFPHFLDCQLTDGSKVVSPTHWQPPRKIPDNHFC